MKHILFIITSADKVGTNNHKTGYEFSEVADPYIEFMNAGYTVDFASIKGGCPPEDGFDENQELAKEHNPKFRLVTNNWSAGTNYMLALCGMLAVVLTHEAD